MKMGVNVFKTTHLTVSNPKKRCRLEVLSILEVLETDEWS
jgi:hypothetical protein